jgi:hypothetical protein
MYACIHRTWAGFFDGVCALNDQACISTDPPLPPHNSWFASWQYYLPLTKVLPLTAANVYSLLYILCLAIISRAGK